MLTLFLLDERLGENVFIALAFVRHEFAYSVRVFDGDDVSKQDGAKNHRLGGDDEEECWYERC